MKFPLSTLFLILTATSIAACSSSAAEQPVAPQTLSSGEQPGQSVAASAPAWNQTTQVDEQGAVVVEAAPLNLNSQVDSFEFEIGLETHSVDLSMDLATLATLTTDTGVVVQAVLWDAPRGGHHVSGKLVFPSIIDGVSILDGAAKIELQIRDLDAPLRTFEWQLQ